MNTRRKVVFALGAAALGTAITPTPGTAQQPGNQRRIAVLMGYAEKDREAQSRLAAFRERLAAAGWVEGRNVTFDVRWSPGDADLASVLAKEMVALRPDVILSSGTIIVAALQRQTQTIPIVFAQVSDPVGSGFVKSLARPGGNITGLINLEASLVEKQLELLKELSPGLKYVAVMYNPPTAPYAEYYLAPLGRVAPKLAVKAVPAIVHVEADLQKVMAATAQEQGAGLLVMLGGFMSVHRATIIEMAARYRVPATYPGRNFPAAGGLCSYGVDATDLFRRSALYVDRILRGARPADLPVEQPTRFELFVNRKTAAALGITIPQALLLRADRVIE